MNAHRCKWGKSYLAQFSLCFCFLLRGPGCCLSILFCSSTFIDFLHVVAVRLCENLMEKCCRMTLVTDKQAVDPKLEAVYRQAAVSFKARNGWECSATNGFVIDFHLVSTYHIQYFHLLSCIFHISIHTGGSW